MGAVEDTQDELRQLRHTMRDLVALSTLPAVWTGLDSDAIAYSLADVLRHTLSLDLVYIRLEGNAGDHLVEVALGKDRPDAAAKTQEIGRALEPWLSRDISSPTPSVPNPLGSGSLRLAVVRFGHFGDLGVLAAGSQRSEFPSKDDQVLLGVATNQAAIVLQRYQAERAVQEHREWLRVTLASIGDAVITTDTEGRITYLNAVAESLIGWKHDEAVGLPLDAVFCIVNEQTRQPIANPATRALEDGVVTGLANHTVLIHKDGTERPIDDSAAPIRDKHGHVVGCVLIFRDITERRRAEQALSRLAAIVESSDDAIVSKDLDGIIASWNAGAERIFGYTEAEAVGRSIRLIIPPERDAEEDEVLRRLRNGERIEHFETERRARDGRKIDISLTVSPIRDAAGHIIGASKTARDITERKRAEEALRSSEERFRGIFHQTLAGIAQTDLTGRFVEVNERYCEIVGRRAEDLCRLRMEDITHPDDPPRNRDLFLSLVQGAGQPYVIEKRYLRPDGSEVWVSNSVSLLRDPHGAPTRAVAVCLDITDRKEAERAVAASEQQFHQLADAMPQIVWSARPDGTIDYYNERWYEYTRRPYSEDGQTGWEELLHPDDAKQCVESFFDCTRTGQPYQREARFQDRSTGGYRWFLVRALPMRDEQGEVLQWFGTCTDIDDTKRAGDRLRLLWEAAALLLAANDPDAMLRELFAKIGPQLGLDTYLHYLIDDTGDALRLASCVGIPEETARSIARLDFGQPICGSVALQRQPIVATHIQQSVDAKDQLAKSIGIRAYTCNPLLSKNQLLGTLFFGSRTKDRFDADERVFLDTICHYLTLAYERLRLLNQLKEADRQKDDFLAMLAHELRNPLAPIRNAVHILNQLGAQEPRLTRARATIERQVDHEARLLEDLLDVTRISRGKITLRAERLDLAQIVRDTAEDSRSAVEQAGITFSVGLPEEPVWVEGDPTRLAQIVNNLLINAAKFTEAGGQVMVRLEADTARRRAAIVVRDTGIGIAPDMLARIFDRFAQAERSLHRSQGGLGLGLALVKGLTELQGGEVQVESAGPGRGAQFTVLLPTTAVPVATEAAVGPDVSSGRAARVLIVEDNRDAAETLREVLELSGHTVEVTYSGSQAVEAAQRFRPEVVLCDLGLPGMDGYEVAAELRKNATTRASYLVAVSGYGQEEDRQKSRKAGFDRHLTKPLNLEEVQQLLLALKPCTAAERNTFGSGHIH